MLRRWKKLDKTRQPDMSDRFDRISGRKLINSSVYYNTARREYNYYWVRRLGVYAISNDATSSYI